MKKYFLLLIIPIFLFAEQIEKSYINWKFKTKGEVFSHPVVSDDIIYFGSNDKNLYAVSLSSEEQIWTFETSNTIQSTILINQNELFFNNGNTIYSIDKNTGEMIWEYSIHDTISENQLDSWDFHHGTPVISGPNIYFGMKNGKLYGFELKSGDLNSQFTTLNSAAIRCSPTIKSDVIYFGDWNGIVYAYNTATNDTLWTYRTYVEQPYPTFGQLNTEFVVYDSLLIFGGRSPELQVINANTGKKVWNFVSEDGGWISGDPIVKNDTLYIAGSDNHKLFSFNAFTGEQYWEYEFLFNNFSKPLLYKEFIIFTTGDAYSQYVANNGYGYLYALNRKDGSIRNVILFDGNAYSTPVTDYKNLYIASEDMHLYAIDLHSFLYDPPVLTDIGYKAVELKKIIPNQPGNKITINYLVNFPSIINVMISNLQGDIIKKVSLGEKSEGQYIFEWDGKDLSYNNVPDGYYNFEMQTGIFHIRSFIQKGPKQ